jgi:hypothetical protein
MDKNTLLKMIAETGYNVGFGAKKHFATYDIVEKAPGWIGILSLAVGVFALFIDDIANNKILSAAITILGVGGLYISFYNDKKDNYVKAAVEILKLFNRLKSLYFKVQASSSHDFTAEHGELEKIENEFYNLAITKQIFLSDWYAHIKFFWQHQIDWIDEQKHFKFMRDKVPLSAHFAIIVLAATGIYFVIPTISKIWCH